MRFSWRLLSDLSYSTWSGSYSKLWSGHRPQCGGSGQVTSSLASIPVLGPVLRPNCDAGPGYPQAHPTPGLWMRRFPNRVRRLFQRSDCHCGLSGVRIGQSDCTDPDHHRSMELHQTPFRGSKSGTSWLACLSIPRQWPLPPEPPESTANIFSAWGRMMGGQLFLLIMNAWCLRLFVSMVGSFMANPLSL